MSDPLLSELCSICHSRTPIYTCPRCAARTCALPCYKKHQQRATCSGIRDPTVYVPRSKIATPAGVDHDFNFLSGIERSLSKKDDDAAARKELRSSSRPGLGPCSIKGRGENYHARLRELRVVIHRAPLGMARQRENRTRCAKGDKRLVWTVEWVHQDGTKSIYHDVSETRPIAEVYHQAFRTYRVKRPQEENGQHVPTERRKRRNKMSAQNSGTKDEPELEKQTSQQPNDEEPPFIADAEDPTVNTKGANQDQELDHTSTLQQTQSSENQSQQLLSDEIHHFYLHMPHTFGSETVLIPFDRTSSLSTILIDRKVLEFPTIYALLERPDALPEEYVLEKGYSEQLERVRREADDMFAGADDGLGRTVGNGDKGEQDEEVDEKKLLDVLRRDVGGRV